MAAPEFARRLRWLREYRGFSRTELATQARVSPQMIENWENHANPVKPRRQNVIKVARVLAVDPDELLTLAGRELLDDEERAELSDENWQRFNQLWPRLASSLTTPQREALLDFLETLAGDQPRGGTGRGKPIVPGSGVIPPVRDGNGPDSRDG